MAAAGGRPAHVALDRWDQLTGLRLPVGTQILSADGTRYVVGPHGEYRRVSPRRTKKDRWGSYYEEAPQIPCAAGGGRGRVPEPVELREELKRRRVEAWLPQWIVAARMGVSHARLSELERGVGRWRPVEVAQFEAAVAAGKPAPGEFPAAARKMPPR